MKFKNPFRKGPKIQYDIDEIIDGTKDRLAEGNNFLLIHEIWKKIGDHHTGTPGKPEDLLWEEYAIETMGNFHSLCDGSVTGIITNNPYFSVAEDAYRVLSELGDCMVLRGLSQMRSTLASYGYPGFSDGNFQPIAGECFDHACEMHNPVFEGKICTINDEVFEDIDEEYPMWDEGGENQEHLELVINMVHQRLDVLRKRNRN